MAGDPAPLAAVQAAVLKSAASAQGQEPASQNSQSGAVTQDLAVMADLAKGYSAGAIAGNLEAENQRASASTRMAEEAAQAQAARARALDLQRLQTQEMAARAARDAQETQLRIKEAQAEGERRRQALEAENGGLSDEEVARRQNLIMDVQANARANVDSATNIALDTVTKVSRSPQEALDYFDQLQREGEFAGVNRAIIERYATALFDADAGRTPKALASSPSSTSLPFVSALEAVLRNR